MITRSPASAVPKLLSKKVWQQAPNPCEALTGCGSPAVRRLAWLAELAETRKVFLRDVDSKTALLFVQTWKALLGRAQVVEQIGIESIKFDGAEYRFSQGELAGRIVSPRASSVLGRAVLAVEWLEQLIESPAAGDAEDMALVRSELRDVLTRTKNHEPCLRPYEG